MYLNFLEGEYPLLKENIWYTGDTSIIYKVDNMLYKMYLKKEPYKRYIMDILISNNNLRDIGALPIEKIKTNLGNYGITMEYIPNSITFWKYLKSKNPSTEDIINKLIILSDNLKRINKEDIHFSDLHHNNILIREDGYPIYIDFDDAVIKEYTSSHICCMAYYLHEVNLKPKRYKAELIQYGDLDKKSLLIMLLNFILNEEVEKKSYYDFKRMVEKLSDYFPNDFLTAIDKLKSESNIIIPYEYYVGDFLKHEAVKEGCKLLRRDRNGHNCSKNNK